MKEGSVFLQILWFGLLKDFLSTHSTFSSQPIQRSTSRKKCFRVSFLHHLNWESLSTGVHPRSHSTITLCSMDSISFSANAAYCSHCVASLSLLKWPQGTHKPSSHLPSSSFCLETGWKVVPLPLVVLELKSVSLQFSTLWPKLYHMGHSEQYAPPIKPQFIGCLKMVTMSLPAMLSLFQAKWPRLRWASFMPHESQSSHHDVSFPCYRCSKSLWVCASLHRIPCPSFGLSSCWWGRTRRHHINSIHLSVQPKIPYLFAVHLIFSFKRVSSRGLKLFRHSQGASHQSA